MNSLQMGVGKEKKSTSNEKRKGGAWEARSISTQFIEISSYQCLKSSLDNKVRVDRIARLGLGRDTPKEIRCTTLYQG